MSLAAGVRLNNRFTLRELIGTGGMSWVWWADDEILGRPVAVKILMGSPAADPALRSATWTEARAAARLNHPNVTQVYDYGETAMPDGGLLPYLVMELVDGENLADRLRYGPLPWQQAAAVASQVASALAAAHGMGVVHRDIKPGNVMLTRSGVKVLDFGIAALAGGPVDDGRLVGTPAYAAPESLRTGAVTPATDVYALGALFYETLTGRPPIAAADWDQAAAAHYGGVRVEPPQVPGLPRLLRRLCAACLSPHPAERPTAAELAEGLAAGAGHEAEASTEMHAPAMSTVATPGPAGYGEYAADDGYGYGPPAAGEYPTQVHYAADSAYPLGPPTTAGESGGAAHRALSWARRQPRWLLALVGAATAVILVALISLVAAGSKPNELPPLAQPSTADATGTAAPLEEATTAEPTPSETTPSPVPIMSATPRSLADRLDAVINSALSAGRISRSVANTLRDKVNELRTAMARNRAVHKAVRTLRQTIEELRSRGDLDKRTADQLLALL